LSLCFYSSVPHRDLHSFPTRRSSDLPPINAKFGPHKQAVLPPLPFQGFPPVRPADVVASVYKFAAEHPEVLGYVPCYCGCERSGDRKSTRLNSSHVAISYAVFCLKKK